MERKRLTIDEIIEEFDKKFPMRKCVVCGTEKVCTNYSDYAWKLNGKFCCSYTCFRVLEKKALEKRTEKKTLMSK